MLATFYSREGMSMTRPRSTLVSLVDTAWYHCISRCVRRAFLCGVDTTTGQCFEHRRGWVITRAKELANLFAIDIAAYAIMSNHYHLVVRVDRVRAKSWDTTEVLTRWTQLFKGPLLVNRYLSIERMTMGRAEINRVEQFAEDYRQRLYDLSWFMRLLNEPIARQANAEDRCTGRFWEGRFTSQALLDEQALLTVMVYVDLNPIRAGMAPTPETSGYTSIQERLQGEVFSVPSALPDLLDTDSIGLPQAPLMPFDATGRTPWAIPFSFEDYAELVDWTGRLRHPNKKGRIAEWQPAILARTGLNTEAFIAFSGRLFKAFGSAIGAPDKLVALSEDRQKKYLRGMQAARRVFT